MCLNKIEEFNITKSYGWKVFKTGIDGKLYPMFAERVCTPNIIPKRLLYNRWLNEKDYCTNNTPKNITIEYKKDLNGKAYRKMYKRGFHIFKYQRDAIGYRGNGKLLFDGTRYVVKKVCFKDVVATGISLVFIDSDNRGKTIIATQIKIIN